MKFCRKCDKKIDEYNPDFKWAMIITKKGQKIIEFECFHLECWKGHFEEAVQYELEKRKKDSY